MKDINLREQSVENLSENWKVLIWGGKKEILQRIMQGTPGLGMIETLARLDTLEELVTNLTNPEAQALIDILSKHGKTWGLHYAYKYNTCVKSKSEIRFEPSEDKRCAYVFVDERKIGFIGDGKFYTDMLFLKGFVGIWTLEFFPDDLEVIRQEIAKYPHVPGVLSGI